MDLLRDFRILRQTALEGFLCEYVERILDVKLNALDSMRGVQ